MDWEIIIAYKISQIQEHKFFIFFVHIFWILTFICMRGGIGYESGNYKRRGKGLQQKRG